MPNTTYYVRTYATNFAGTAYSNQIKFKTLLHTPVASEATSINNTGFVANWRSVTGATNYQLDVSASPSFTTTKSTTLVQQFNDGLTSPDGWTFSKNISVNDIQYKDVSPALEFKTTNARIITNKLNGAATELQFWIKGINTDNLSALLVEGFDGTTWTVIKNINNLPTTGTIETFNAISDTHFQNKFIQFRFTYTKSKGSLVFDDVSIKYNHVIPYFVNGYNNLKVKNTAFAVTGLNTATNYYYRVRAITDFNTSKNSNVISVVTCSLQNCHGSDANIIQSIAKSSSLNVNVFPNPTSDEFTLEIQNINDQQIKIFVSDVYGKEIYQTSGSNNKYVFGKGFSSGIYFVRIIQANNIKTLKLIKVN